jgi:hypothetical protein
VGMRQSAAWGLYLVAGTTAQSASIALSLLLGGSMVANGLITPEQLTSFMFYVQVSGGVVCWGGGITAGACCTVLLVGLVQHRSASSPTPSCSPCSPCVVPGPCAVQSVTAQCCLGLTLICCSETDLDLL